MEIKDDNKCYCCNKIDDLIHYFITCKIVIQFWKRYSTWWNTLNIIQMDLKRHDIIENIIFGYMNDDDQHYIINLCILYAKSFIHIQKQSGKKDICFYTFLSILKYKLSIEYSVHVNQMKFAKARMLNTVIMKLEGD